MMTGQDFEALETFALVAEHGSFTGAAQARNVSQPAASMQVRQLEDRLGLRLLERIGRRVRPTPAGLAMLDHVRRLRIASVDALDAMTPYREGAVGRVRIGTGATACIYLLPPILRRLRERLPGLEVVVETGNSGDVLRQVEDNALDLGLVTLPAAARALEVTPLLEDELVAILPPGEAVSGPATARFLASRPLALYEPGGRTRQLIADWFAAAGIQPRPIMQLGSIEAIKKLVGAGICCSVIPRTALEGTTGRDMLALPLSPPRKRGLGVAMRRDKRLDRGLRELLQLLRGLADEKGRPPRAGPRLAEAGATWRRRPAAREPGS